MKKSYMSLPMVALLSSLALAGCSNDDGEEGATGGAGGASGGSESTGGDSSTGGDEAGTGGAGGEDAGTGGDTATGGEDAGTGGDDAGADADFKVMTIDGVGDVITNEAGFTLYFFASDIQGGEGTGVSGTWPAVMVSDPAVGAGLSASDFGVTPKGQSTYDGLPLYTFKNDTMPGEANGESNAWPVAKPKN